MLLVYAFALQMCAGQTVISKSTLSYNFTLSAVNTTLPNANTAGVPLVLGQNGERVSCPWESIISDRVAGATTGMSFYVTSVNHAMRFRCH